MSTTPNIALTEYPAGALAPSASYNDAMQVLDALVGPCAIVQDKDLTTPPTTVGGDVGKRWVIPSGATGVWSGKTGQIALCTAATVWRYFTPVEGWRAYMLDEDSFYIYDSTWQLDAARFGVVPQNSHSADYTLVLADAGVHQLHPSADTTGRTFTIPANSSVSYAVGTVLTFVNQDSAGTLTIAITTDTMRLAVSGSTGSRTLAANGIATAIKLTATEWLISGSGLT